VLGTELSSEEIKINDETYGVEVTLKPKRQVLSRKWKGQEWRNQCCKLSTLEWYPDSIDVFVITVIFYNFSEQKG